MLGFTLIFIGAMAFSIMPGSLHQQTSSVGVQASSSFNLSNNSGDSIYPSIATSGDNIYVAWQDDNFGESISYAKRNYDILFTKSLDGGERFENITNLSNTISISERPAITALDNSVYVVWSEITPIEKKILFRESTDAGNTFDDVIYLGNSSFAKDYISPKSIAVFGDNVYVVWRHVSEDGKKNSILLKSSKDAGNTFGETVEISGNATFSSSPKVATSNNNVYVVWDANIFGKEKTDKSDGIFLVKSSDNGLTFGKESRINGIKKIGETHVVAYLNELYIAWASSVYYYSQKMGDVFLAYSLNGGNTFEETITINNNLEGSASVDLAIIEKRIGAVWQDQLTGNGDIFYKISSNSRPSFNESPTNLSDNPGSSECPSIALSENAAYIIWEDSTHGDREILFKKVVLT